MDEHSNRKDEGSSPAGFANSLQLDDMRVIGTFSPKMIKALATIAVRLHPAYDELEDKVRIGLSKESCLFSSLVVRRFLVSIGFADATVQPCSTYIRSERAGEELWSLGIGTGLDKRVSPAKFPGHVAVVVPSERILIDTTLYQAIRPHWHGALTGMMALTLDDSTTIIAGVAMKKDDVRVEIRWCDRPDINWRRQFDTFDPRSMNRQRRLTQVLQDAFGEYRNS